MCLQIRPIIVTSFFLVAMHSFGNDKNKKEETSCIACCFLTKTKRTILIIFNKQQIH